MKDDLLANGLLLQPVLVCGFGQFVEGKREVIAVLSGQITPSIIYVHSMPSGSSQAFFASPNATFAGEKDLPSEEEKVRLLNWAFSSWCLSSLLPISAEGGGGRPRVTKPSVGDERVVRGGNGMGRTATRRARKVVETLTRSRGSSSSLLVSSSFLFFLFSLSFSSSSSSSF